MADTDVPCSSGFDDALATLDANIRAIRQGLISFSVDDPDNVRECFLALVIDQIPAHVWEKIKTLPEAERVKALKRAVAKTIMSVIPNSKHGKRKWAAKHAGKRWGQKRVKGVRK